MRNEVNKTDRAVELAADTENDADEVNAAWWELFSNYRIKKWKKELRNLSEKTGITLSEVGQYIGMENIDPPGFYTKLPRKRETYIAVGMAFRLSLDEINRWIKKYGKKKALYVKDVLCELIWIYLITANSKDKEGNINYYRMYDECKAVVKKVYFSLWTEIIDEKTETAEIEQRLRKIEFDSEFHGIAAFVAENLDAFKTAYKKPRKYLNDYVNMILKTKNDYCDKRREWKLNSLRGYLDDSMINYLSGSYETINVLEGVRGRRTPGIKSIPKSKKKHISICLALGMTAEDINEYLDMMGYAELDGTDRDESVLINMLNRWEEDHPIQRKYKNRYIKKQKAVYLKKDDEINAVNEMLGLRQDLKQMYKAMENPLRFPYLND